VKARDDGARVATVEISEADMRALVGHTFPGGSYRIEHWENFLLSDATGAPPLQDTLAHPVHLFHAPIIGVGVTIGELFALARADRAAPVSIDYYDWEIFAQLREGVVYEMQGGIVEYERKEREGGPTTDSFTYRIEMTDEAGAKVARVEFRWHYWRFAS
jgi:hypothetical protein